jgi:uncharacterized Zn finger protein (UPF0148 family)
MTFEGLPVNRSQIKTTGLDYKAIMDEAAELKRLEPELLKLACPRCGTPLQVNDKGVRNCPMGHYRAEG